MIPDISIKTARRRSTCVRHSKMRPSGVDDMYANNSISHPQKKVFDRFGDLLATDLSDGLKAIDYTRQRVDGARFGGGMPLVSRARDELKRVERALGQKQFTALKAAASEGNLNAVKAALGVKSKATASATVKSALGALEELWRPTQ